MRKGAFLGGGSGAKVFLASVGVLLGVFLALLTGVFFIHGKSFSGGGNFLASLSSSLGGFLSREEPIAEIDLAARSGEVVFQPCAYASLEKPRSGNVIFNEISWMGTKENYNAEWMELHNVSENEVNISF